MVQGGGLRGGGGNQLAVQVVQQGIRQFGRAQSRRKSPGSTAGPEISLSSSFSGRRLVVRGTGDGGAGRAAAAVCSGCMTGAGGRFLNGRFLVGGAGSGTDQPGNQTGADQESFQGADSYSFIPLGNRISVSPFLQRVKKAVMEKASARGDFYIRSLVFTRGWRKWGMRRACRRC